MFFNLKIALEKILSKLDVNGKRQDSNFPKELKNRRLYYLYLSLTTIFIAVSTVSIRQVGMLQELELSAYDRLIRLNDRPRQNKELLLVEITDRDIKNQNS